MSEKISLDSSVKSSKVIILSNPFNSQDQIYYHTPDVMRAVQQLWMARFY